MYPEAGGSSSFARHAFNELVELLRRLGPDAQLHHHGRDLGLLRAALPGRVLGAARGRRPADVIVGGVVLIAPARRAQRQGDARSRPGSTWSSRSATSAPRSCWSLIGPGPRLQPGHPGRQRRPRGRADLERLPARDRGRDDRLHRHRDDLEHGRGGAGRREDDPARHRPHGARRDRPLRAPAADRALGDAGRAGRRRAPTRTELGTTFADDPVLGIVENLGLGAGLHRRAARLRRHPRGDDPDHRHQRRR